MSSTFAEVVEKQRTGINYDQLLRAIEQTVPLPTADEVFAVLHRQSLKASEIHMTPDLVARLMAAVGKTIDPHSVLDFTCGTGQLLHYCSYTPMRTGVDINPLAIKLAQTILPDISFQVGDALELDVTQQYDLIISNLPFGVRVRHKGRHEPLEKLLLEKALTLLNKGGMFVALVPPNLLTAPLYAPFRKHVLQHYALDMIVSLPVNTLEYTSIPSSILVIRNGKPNKTVYLADYEGNIQELIGNVRLGRGQFQISLSKIGRRWDRHYYQPKYQQMDDLLKDHFVQSLGEISDVIRGYHFRREERFETGKYLILTPRNFQHGKLEHETSYPNYYTNSIENHRFYEAVVQPGDILFTLISRPSFYLYQVGDPPAVASAKIAIIRSNDNEYIRTYLQTAQGQALFLGQAEQKLTGTHIRQLTIRSLRNIRVPILPLGDLNALSDKEISQAQPEELENLREELAFYKQELSRLQVHSQEMGSMPTTLLRETAHAYQATGPGSLVSSEALIEQILIVIDDRFKQIETTLKALEATANQILALVKNANSQIQSIKQTPRAHEEKLLRIYSQLDDISGAVTGNRRTIDEYARIVQHWLDYWHYLDEASKKFLSSAEFLLDEIHNIGDEDYSPFIIQYCRAIENEILKKLFQAYHADIYNRAFDLKRFLTEDLDDGNTSVFAKAVMKDNSNYTLGQMSRIMQFLKPGGKTLKRSSLLQDFRTFALKYFEAQILSEEYLGRIQTISEDYRNKAAHPYILGIEMAQSCQGLIRDALNQFLASYLAGRAA